MMTAALAVSGFAAGLPAPFVLTARAHAAADWRINLLSSLTVAFAAGLMFFTGVM